MKMKWMTELERKPATIIFKLHYTEYSSLCFKNVQSLFVKSTDKSQLGLS